MCPQEGLGWWRDRKGEGSPCQFLRKMDGGGEGGLKGRVGP